MLDFLKKIQKKTKNTKIDRVLFCPEAHNRFLVGILVSFYGVHTYIYVYIYREARRAELIADVMAPLVCAGVA